MDTTAFPTEIPAAGEFPTQRPASPPQAAWPSSDTQVYPTAGPVPPITPMAPPTTAAYAHVPAPNYGSVPPFVPGGPIDLSAGAVKPPKRSGTGSKVIAGTALAALLFGGAGAYAGTTMANNKSGNSTSASITIGNNTTGASMSKPANGSIAAIAAAVTPSVVKIEERDGQGGGGTGTGFVISSDGYILTNNHVAGTGTLSVQFADGTKASAKLVGANQQYDVAVIKVDKTGLPAVALGDSDKVKVGDTAIAIGSPLGLEGTVTAGIISALNRPVTAGGENGGDTSYINAIQTDAPINPGNSGGPLINGAGEVIGINSAIASMPSSGGGQPGSIGLGFAIPMQTASRLAQEIIKTGHSSTPIVGVKLDMNSDAAKITEVTAGGPAEAAGLKVGDVLTKVDGKPVGSGTDFIVAVRANSPGDVLTLTVERGGSPVEVKVTLGSQQN